MKRTATGLLVAATAVLSWPEVLEGDTRGSAYVRATAEAAMIGAVGRLVRGHRAVPPPLGIPIPHTAIIPSRKDDIGRGLGTFVAAELPHRRR